MRDFLLYRIFIFFFCIFTFNIFPQQWEWIKEFHDINNISIGRDVIIDDSSNIFMVGAFADTLTLDSILLITKGSLDILIIKCNANGDILWAKNAGSVDDDMALGIATDSSSNIYITGFFRKTAYFDSIIIVPEFGADIFIAKMNSNGDFLWVKKATGNAADDFAWDIAIDKHSNIYLTGSFVGRMNFGNYFLNSMGNNDIFIVKYNDNGTCIWAKRAGGEEGDVGFGLAVDDSQNVFVTGYFQGLANFGTRNIHSFGVANSADIFLTKLNSDGIFQWVKQYGGIEAEIAYGISLSNDYIDLTGSFYGTPLFDTTSIISKGYRDIFLAKFDHNGRTKFVKSAGSSSTDDGKGVIENSSGNTYICGNFKVSASFDSINLTSLGGWDLFVAKYDIHGNILWVLPYGTPNNDFCFNLTADKSGNIFVIGTTNDEYTSFNIGHDFFIGKIKDIFVSVDSSDDLFIYPNHFSLSQNYPNPFNPNTKIRYTIPLQGGDERGGSVTLKVYDVLGNEVATLVNEYKPAGSHEVEFSARGGQAVNGRQLASGIYLYQLKAGEFVETKKMILLR